MNEDEIVIKQNYIYYEDDLPYEYSRHKAPRDLLNRRNLVIISLFIQIITACVCFALLMARKAKIYFGFNGIALLIGILGLQGAIKMRRNYLMTHAFVLLNLYIYI